MPVMSISEGTAGRARHSRRRRDLRHRGRAESTLGAVVVCLFLAVVLGAAAYLVVVRQETQPGRGLTPAELARAHAGRILFVPVQGKVCREVAFNNDGRPFETERSLPCDDALAAAAAPAGRSSAGIYNSFQDSFRNRR
jgi:hypothetical protein